MTTQLPALLCDLHRMIDEYHWRWRVVTSIINRRYGTSYTTAELKRIYEAKTFK